MLSDQERREIQEEIAHMPTKQSASVGALKIVQKHQRYVSDESLKELASMLDMTTAELDSIATFYSLIFRQPVGGHVILVCDSVSCWLMGKDDIVDYLRKKLGIELGGTTSDGMFTLLPVSCLGHCELAPVMMVDEEVIGNLTAEKIDQVLERKTAESRGGRS